MNSPSPIGKRARRLVDTCALGAGALSLFSLACWAADQWEIAALHSGYIPMAPSTGFLLLLLCILLILNNHWPQRNTTRAIAYFSTACSLLAGFVVWTQAIVGVDLGSMQWFKVTTAAVGDIPVGQMSPLSAIAFLLASLAFLFELPPCVHHRRWRQASALLALAVCLIGLVVVMSYATAAPALYGGQTIPMALLTGLAFVLLGTGVMVAAGSDVWPARIFSVKATPLLPTRPVWRGTTFPFLLMGVGVFLGGLWLLRHQVQASNLAAQDNLEAIADLKADQISKWYHERLTDAEIIARSPYLLAPARQCLSEQPGSAADAEFLAWMEMRRKLNNYHQITLYNALGLPRLTVPPDLRATDLSQDKDFQIALRSKKAFGGDLRRDETTTAAASIQLSFWVPIGTTPQPGAPAQGVLRLQIDPHAFLYPLVQSWPTLSQTAETLLIRREGDNVLYLNELRHRKNSPLTFHLPIAPERHLPAAAAARGEEGLMQGTDYRNVPVLAAIRRVPGTSWMMVAKVDRDEVNATLRERVWLTCGLLVALIGASGLGMGLLLKQRDLAFSQHELAAERERQALLRHFDYLTKYANDIILLADENQRIVEANDRACAAYGYTREELLALSARDLRPADMRSGLAEVFDRAQAEEGLMYETRQQRKDGSTFPVEISLRLIKTEDRAFYQAIMRDTTERKEAEDALRASERRYRTTFDSILEGCQLIGFDWRYLYINDAAEAHNRRPKEEMLGREMTEVWPGIEATNVYGVERRCMEERIPFRIENEFVFPDGSTGWFDLRINPVPEGIFILSNDITGQKQTEKALEGSEERFRRAIVESPVPTILHAEDGTIIELSRSWCEISGYSREELKTISDWTRRAFGEDKAHAETVIGGTYGLECRVSLGDSRIRTRDGDTRIWDYSAAPMGRLPDGRQLVVSIAIDVTERRQAETEISRLNAELEQRVHERTGELEVSNKELEAFSYSVSHDLRAPLRGIDGWSLALLEDYGDQLDDQAREYVGTIRAQTQRMGQLIDDLLQLARVTRAEMQRKPVDLSAIAQSVADRLLMSGPGRKVDFTIAPGLKAHGDVGLLEIVLENLLGNAFKFTSRREAAQIEFGIWRGDGLPPAPLPQTKPGAPEGPAPKAVYYVRDNGAGFDMQYADKLFGAFQRMHKTSDFPGTGIGLATVQRIIRRHGGRVWANAEVDHGATFCFTLERNS